MNIDFTYDSRGWLHVMSPGTIRSGSTSVYVNKNGREYLRSGKSIDRPTKVWSVTSSYHTGEKAHTHSARFRNRKHAEAWLHVLARI